MEGSRCVAALEAAPAQDAPRPLRPGAKQGAAGGVRGERRRVLVEIPPAWSCCGGGAARGTLWREEWGGPWLRGGGRMLLLPGQTGIYCCLGVRKGKCRLISDRDKIL